MTEVLARTQALVEGGASTDEIVSQLRADGFRLVESVAGLMRATGMTGAGALDAVASSPAWADVHETVESHRWIAPPNPPSDDSVEQLRAACDDDPRTEEAWFTGRRIDSGRRVGSGTG